MKYIFFVFLCTFAVSCCVAESNPTPLRGLQSLLHKTYPYLVSLRKSDQHYCSGVAIAVYKVLTAAYCIHEQVQSQNFSKIRAVIELNGYEIDSGMTTGCYKNTQAYPQFDFGILTLKEPAHVMKAVVPDETEQDHYPFSGDETVLIKWNELYCDDIKAVAVETTTRRTCLDNFFGRGEHFLDDLICAEPETKNEFIKESDVGSPLILNGKVIGILSGGSLQNEEYFIFTNLFEYTSYLADAKSKSKEIKKIHAREPELIDVNHRNKIRRIH